MGEFPSTVQGVMTQQTKGGNYQFQAYGDAQFNSVSTAAQVANLNPANCASYQIAATAASSALQPDGIGTNTDALYYYDTSIPQPGYITTGLKNGTVVAAPVAGGSGPNGNSVGGAVVIHNCSSKSLKYVVFILAAIIYGLIPGTVRASCEGRPSAKDLQSVADQSSQASYFSRDRADQIELLQRIGQSSRHASHRQRDRRSSCMTRTPGCPDCFCRLPSSP